MYITACCQSHYLDCSCAQLIANLIQDHVLSIVLSMQIGIGTCSPPISAHVHLHMRCVCLLIMASTILSYAPSYILELHFSEHVVLDSRVCVLLVSYLRGASPCRWCNCHLVFKGNLEQ